jgi:hypothetical protein
MCNRHNLGPRVRLDHLRKGVIWHGLALAFGFGLVESGRAAQLGFLLILPLATGIYCVLAGSFGVCFYHSVFGKRHADHGLEGVPDAELRQRLVRRGVLLATVSCTLAAFATTLFVASV